MADNWQDAPESRVHVIAATSPEEVKLVLVQEDHSYRLLANTGSGHLYNADTNPLYYGYSAPYDPNQTFRILDLTNHMRAPIGEKYLPNCTWEPMDGSELPSLFKIFLGPQEAGVNYTLLIYSPEGGGSYQSITARAELGGESLTGVGADGVPYSFEPEGYSALSFIASHGMSVAVGRNADNASVGYRLIDITTGQMAFNLEDQFPPLQREHIQIMVRQTLGGRNLKLQQSAGTFPLIPSAYGGVITDYTGSGEDNSFSYQLYTCESLPKSGVYGDQSFWILDEGEMGGILTSNANQEWVYDGWSWIGGAPASPDPNSLDPNSFTIILPSSRAQLLQWQGIYNFDGEYIAGGEVGIYGEYTAYDAWHSAYIQRDMYGFSGSVYSPENLGIGPWYVRDEWTGETRSVEPGVVNNLLDWTPPPVACNIQVSLTRWGHDLRVRCDDGTEFPISQLYTQGQVTPSLQGQAIFNPAYYFEAHSFRSKGVSYWVWDATTNEESQWNTTDLTEWKHIEPIRELVAENAALNSVALSWKFSNGASSFRIERRQLSGVGDGWDVVGSVSGWLPIGETKFKFSDSEVVHGASNMYRVTAIYENGAEGRSAKVTIFASPESGGESIPIHERDGEDGLFPPMVNLRNPWLPSTGLGVTKLPGGGSASTLDLSSRIIPTPGTDDWGLQPYLRPDSENPENQDVDPSKVKIWYRRNFLGVPVLVQRRQADGSWHTVGSSSTQEGEFVDSVTAGEVYYYRLRTNNATGLSEPTRMQRWIPHFYIRSMFTTASGSAHSDSRNPDLSESSYYPSENDPQPWGAGNSYSTSGGTVNMGDSIGMLPSPPSFNRSAVPTTTGGVVLNFPAARWDHYFKSTDYVDFEGLSQNITDDSTSEEMYFTQKTTANGRTLSAGGSGLIAYLVTRTSQDRMTTTFLKQAVLSIGSGWTTSNVDVDSDERQCTIKWSKSPALRGSDLFSSQGVDFGQGEAIGQDYRRAVDRKEELLIEREGPLDQASIYCKSINWGSDRKVFVDGDASRFEIVGCWTEWDDELGEVSREEVIHSGEDWGDAEYLIVRRTPICVPGDKITVKVTFTPKSGVNETLQLGSDENGNPVEISDQIDVKCIGGTISNYELSSEEASGSRYRRVAITGKPIADSPAVGSPEEASPLSGTYVDALTLQLQHEATDIALSIPGSTLPFGVARRSSQFTWHTARSLSMDRQFSQPFGTGWSSALGIQLKVEATVGREAYAYITDQEGAQHRFLAASAAPTQAQDGSYSMWEQLPDKSWQTYCLSSFTALPSGQHEGTAGSTLQGPVFRSKQGVTIEFEPIQGLNCVLVGTGVGGAPRVQSYLRPKWVKDAVGNQLIYEYAASDRALPQRIYLKANPTNEICIRYNASNHVTKIWDPRGYTTEYQYQDFGPACGEVLSRVIANGQVVNAYTYEVFPETDTRPLGSEERPGLYMHFNLTRITDARNNVYQFTYATDTSKTAFSSKTGAYQQSGLPRLVKTIALPGTAGNVIFDNLSNFAVVPVAAGNNILLQAVGNRLTKVTDLAGTTTQYNFLDNEAHLFDLASYIIGAQSMFPPTIVYHKKMEIARGGFGMERYEFEPAAGLALKKVTDVGGRVTKYGYADYNESGVASGLGALFPNLGNFAAYNGEPTWIENTAGERQYIAYNRFRERIGTIDETRIAHCGDNWETPLTNEVRQWKLSLNAESLKQAVVESGVRGVLDWQNVTTGPARTKTTYQYGSPNFRGVVTTQTVKSLPGDPAWAQDLVVQRSLNASGRIQREISGGVVTDMTYDLNGNRTSITDGRQFLTSFFYDGRNRLIRTLFPSPETGAIHSRAFEYDGAGNKTKEMDENGRTTSFFYDQRNRLIRTERSVDGVPLATSSTYNSMGMALTKTDARGTVTEYTYDSAQRLSRVDEAFGKPEVKTTLYRYPGFAGGNDPVAATIGGNGYQPTRVTDARGFITRTEYDELFRLSSVAIAYKAAGQDPLSASAVARTVTEYDTAGRVVKVTDPLNKITQTSYDDIGRPETVTYADESNTQTYYTATGLKWKVRDEAGYSYETEYDAGGRVTRELGPELADGTRPSTQLEYDLAGILAAKKVQINGGANPTFAQWNYEYDGRNRMIEERGPLVETGRSSVLWAYDAVGNVVSSQDARGKTTDTTYDALNRVRTVTGSAVSNVEAGLVRSVTETQYDANGNVTKVIDAEGRETVNTYDALNRLKTSKDPANITVENTYDAAGNRVALKDGKLQTTTFTYDGLNRLLTNQPPTGPPQVTTYDAMNRLTYNDGSVRIIYYYYDERHRKIWMGESESGQRSYGYDAVGRLITVSDGDARANVDYTYDPAGRLTSETSAGLLHSYYLDLSGNRVRTEYRNADGSIRRTLNCTYDAAGRLKIMSEFLGSVAQPQSSTRSTSYFYDANGNVVKKVLPNGDEEHTSYDALNRRRLHQVKHGTIYLFSFDQYYDRTGNVRVSLERVHGEPVKDRRLELEYDGASRLVWERSKKHTDSEGSWTDDGATKYVYDNANNRTLKERYAAGQTTAPAEHCESSYNGLNQLTRYERWDADGFYRVRTFLYDNAGNRQLGVTFDNSSDAGSVDGYSYDSENRLQQVTRIQDFTGITLASMAAVYDYRSRRVYLEENSEWTSVSFSGGTSVREDAVNGESPGIRAEYIRGSDWGGGVGGLLYSLRPGLGVEEPRFTHYNGRGDVVLQTDQTGVKKYEAAYEAFGTRTRESGVSADRQRANTKEEHSLLQLLNEGHRYRDLETGVWLTRDPAGFVDGPNMYAYVQQNPWSKFDPEGLHWADFRSLPNCPPGVRAALNEQDRQTGERVGKSIRSAVDFGAGTAIGYGQVIFGVNHDFYSDTSELAAGVNAGRWLGTTQASVEVAGGAMLANGGQALTLGSGGTLVVPGQVAAAGGVAAGVHGSWALSNAAKLGAENTDKPSANGGSEEPSAGRAQPPNQGNGSSGKPLKEWLKDDQDLLDEARSMHKSAPEWQGIDPDTTNVFYRSKAEVDAIRAKPGESGGHHPHGLALGGPEGQKLTPTSETRTVKNPQHSQASGLQRRIINRIKKQQ